MDLEIEIEKMWQLKTTVIPSTEGAWCMMSKIIYKHINNKAACPNVYTKLHLRNWSSHYEITLSIKLKYISQKRQKKYIKYKNTNYFPSFTRDLELKDCKKSINE